MAKYKVATTTLQRIEHAAGYWPNGVPKSVVTHNKGDEVDDSDYEGQDNRVEQLVADGSLVPSEEAQTDDLEKAQQELDEATATFQEKQANVARLQAASQPLTIQQQADKAQQDLVAKQQEEAGTSEAAPEEKGGGSPPPAAASSE